MNVPPTAEPLAADGPARADALPDDIASDRPLIELPECDGDAVAALRKELGIGALAAQTLVRRGLRDVASAMHALELEPIADPRSLPGAEAVAQAIAGHLRKDSRIAVHGDYDVDGVSSTAILVGLLTRLGADVTWHVPSRFDEGYGLSVKAIDRLADDGVDLIVAVDCGVGANVEIAHARSLGIDVAVCDHHKPGETLPDVPIAHPGLGGDAQSALCAAAVTFKVGQIVGELIGAGQDEIESELELVAMATVCDVMPLTGENRAMVVRGVELMRRTSRPGLVELMRVAGVAQLAVDSRSFGFALGPRINAAGRTFSADPAVELLLTSSETRAAELAAELDHANSQRRAIERGILQEAESQARSQRDKYAIVVHGERWHPGVLGIVAGRLAESYRRPVIALGVDAGVAAGSGRNGGVFDLHSGLEACADLLIKFGGHRAAAGLELDEASLPAFVREFQRLAAEELTTDDLRPRLTVDAIAEPGELTLDAVADLERLGPFGEGNPVPLVMLPSVRIETDRRMGDSGQHRRFGIAGAGGRSEVVAFNFKSSQLGDDAAVRDHGIVVELDRNEFRGVVKPQLKLRGIAAIDASRESDWWDDFTEAWISGPRAVDDDRQGIDPDRSIDRHGDAPGAILADFVRSAERTLVVANFPSAWKPLIASLAANDDRAADYRVVAYDDPTIDGLDFDRVVLLEPPPHPAFASFGDAEVVIGWNDQTVRAIASRSADLLLRRKHVVDLFRVVRDVDAKGAESLATLLQAAIPSPHVAARAALSLHEISVLRVDVGGSSVESISAVDGARTELDRSQTFRSYSAYTDESERWLRQLTEQQS